MNTFEHSVVRGGAPSAASRRIGPQRDDMQWPAVSAHATQRAPLRSQDSAFSLVGSPPAYSRIACTHRSLPARQRPALPVVLPAQLDRLPQRALLLWRLSGLQLAKATFYRILTSSTLVYRLPALRPVLVRIAVLSGHAFGAVSGPVAVGRYFDLRHNMRTTAASRSRFLPLAAARRSAAVAWQLYECGKPCIPQGVDTCRYT